MRIFFKGAPQFAYIMSGALAVIALAQLSLSFVTDIPINDPVATVTSVSAICATFLSLMLTFSMSRYPGVEASAYLLPSFLIGYGAFFVMLLMTRLGYSRALLFGDLLLAFGWALVAVASSRKTIKVGIVPEGRIERLLEIPGIEGNLLDRERAFKVDAIAADLQYDLSPEWKRFLADEVMKGVPVYHTKHLIESMSGKVEVEHLSENNFGMLAPISAFMAIKHFIDWVVAFAMLIVLAPILLVIGLLIKLDSPGPAIFRQKRMGYRRQVFTMYKFRTMTVEQPAGPDAREAAKTVSGDARITRVGAWLRKTRVDELPQIVNVLLGQMSWIGPRPEAVVLSSWYETELAFYSYRHIVRPGLTGWAQVQQGHVAEIADVQDKLYYDFYYIKNYSFWIDLLIVVRTISVIFSGVGAK